MFIMIITFKQKKNVQNVEGLFMQILSKEKGVNGNNKKKKNTVQKKINVMRWLRGLLTCKITISKELQ